MAYRERLIATVTASIVVLLGSCAMLSAQAELPLLYAESFESDELGSWPYDWSCAAPFGSLYVVDTHVCDGERALMLCHNTADFDTGTTARRPLLIGSPDTLVLECCLLSTNVGQQGETVALSRYDDWGQEDVAVGFGIFRGNFVCADGTTRLTLEGPVQPQNDVIYRMRIEYSRAHDCMSFFADGELLGSISPWGNSMEYVSGVQLSCNRANIACAFFDDLRIFADAVEASIDIDPDVINPRSGGRWVTCYIELPDGFDPADIDVSAILLNSTVAAEGAPTTIGDYDGDGISDLTVKFPRSDVMDILPCGENVEVHVTGLVSGQAFAGVDHVRILDPKVTYPNAGETFAPGEEIQISWEAPTDYLADCYGVYYTEDDGETWNTIAEGVEALSYSWVAPQSASSSYRILIDAHDSGGIMGYDVSDGTFNVGSQSGVWSDRVTLPQPILQGASPNPFTHTAVIRFDMPVARHVTLTVHDVLGRLVVTLIDGDRPAGSHSIDWAGEDADGHPVRGGIYFIRLEVGNRTATAKTVISR
jgi:hypothetical protein